jgi:hypothetical protein
VTFANTGVATTTDIGAPYAGTPVGACLAIALRHARVPPFDREAFTTLVQYRIDAPQ